MKVEFQGVDTTTPQWAVDFVGRLQNLPGGVRLNAAAFAALGDVTVTVAAAAVAGATTITVNALAAGIPSGTDLHFGGAKFASLTADAAAGATTLIVVAIPTALAAGDTTVYSGPNRRKYIRSGTPIGKTRAAATWGPVTITAGAINEDEVYLLLFDVYDAAVNADAEVYRHGNGVKYNYLPNWAALPAVVQARIHADYETTLGSAQ